MNAMNDKCLSNDKKWYSSSYLSYNGNPTNDYHYSSHTNGHQLIDQAIQGIRNQSNDSVYRQDFRHEPRGDSKTPSKRPNACLDDKDHKRSRISDLLDSPNSRVPDFRHNYSNECHPRDVSRDSTIHLVCKPCGSSSHSLKDFAQHMRGRRHQISASRVKQSKVCHKLQQMLDNTKESIVGLDFVKEVQSNHIPQETHLNCLLCKCYQMNIHSTLQHIIGFRHQNNFITFIHPNNKEILMECESRQTDNRLVRSLAQKYEKLYGRGECQYIGGNKSDPVVVNSKIKSNTRGKPKPMLKKEDSDDKVVEAFKSIRNICDQMIAFYSAEPKPSPRLSPSFANNDENQKNALNCWSQMKNICTNDCIKSEK